MRRAANSASIVTIAAHLPMKKGKIAGARLALGGCGDKPVRAAKAEAALEGQKIDADSVARAGALLMEDAAPFTDAYASAWYRAPRPARAFPEGDPRRIARECNRRRGA